MTIFYKFKDGSVIEQDSRREDPLVYYVPVTGWSEAVGFEISPLYKEWEAKRVNIKIWKDHIIRFQAVPKNELTNIVKGFIISLSKTFKIWKFCTFEWPSWLLNKVGEDKINKFMELAGWEIVSDSEQHQWRRVRVINPYKKWWQIWK
jgi:hypothetical protein